MKQFKDKLIEIIKSEKYSDLIQFVKFGLVGVSNTAISYGIDLLCYYILMKNVPWQENTKIIINSGLAFFISVTNSYYWNNRYVFGKNEKKSFKEHVKAYIKTVLCYAVTGLLVSPMIKLWLNRNGLAYWISSICSLIISVPLNFLMNKYWTFGNRKNQRK